MELVALFYLTDEFCKEFEPKWREQRIASGLVQRNKPCHMTLSEILTVIVHFHQSNHRTFKGYYTGYVGYAVGCGFSLPCELHPFSGTHGRSDNTARSIVAQLVGYANKCQLHRLHEAGCLPRSGRIRRNKVFRDLAERGKSSMDWFYGFKLHLMVNERGELTSFMVTPGNTPDNNIATVSKVAKAMAGKLPGTTISQTGQNV